MMPLHFIEPDPNLEAFYCSEKRSVPRFVKPVIQKNNERKKMHFKLKPSFVHCNVLRGQTFDVFVLSYLF